MGQDPSEIREAIEQTRGEMGETIQAIGYKSDVKSRAKDSVAEKVESVKSKLAGVSDRASDAAPSGADVKQGAQRAAGVAKENPIGLALTGVAFGFLAGMALPSTSVEDEKIGTLSADVKDKAKEAGQEALEHGKDLAREVVQSAAETAQGGAQEHGQKLKRSTQDKAQKVKAAKTRS